MRVALLTPEYPPGPTGGIGTSTRTLATSLAELGHDVHVVTLGQEAPTDRRVDVRVIDDRHPPKLGWIVVRRRVASALRDLVASEGIDIVEAPDAGGLSAAMRLDCPVVVRCHGSASYMADLLGQRAPRRVRFAEAMALRRADDVVAVSAFAADRTRALFRLREPIGVIHNSVDVGRFRPSDAEPESDTLLYVGTVTRKKGIIDLCRSFSEVVRVRASARLVVIGRDVPDRVTGRTSTWSICTEHLSSAARARTEYLGPRPHEQLPDLVAGAGFGVLPSYAEAHPLAWLEVAACGRAIVGYDTPWAREIVQPDRSGFLTPLGDVPALTAAVVRLLDDSELRRAAGRAARADAVERFSHLEGAAHTVRWYESVLTRHASIAGSGTEA